MRKFAKYHALGNDYILLDPEYFTGDLTADNISRMCDRHFGVGSDGILFGPLTPSEHVSDAFCRLQIFNPDGSEAEKSGNGLRIFCRYLWDTGRVGLQSFQLETAGGMVECCVFNEGKEVEVEMGCADFRSTQIPVEGDEREVLNESITSAGETFSYCAATVGNPHCVIQTDKVSPELATAYGPEIETASNFPNRTNVQFMEIVDSQNLAIEIWERGAGYTLASGSSACACAAIARRLSLCDSEVRVHMPGGILEIAIGDGYELRMRGGVSPVAEGDFRSELFKECSP